VLAFDRERIRLLNAELRHVIGALGSVSSGDPAANEAWWHVQSAVNDLQPWLDRLRDLAADRLMEEYRPLLGGGGDRAQFDVFLLQAGAGVTVTDDPLGAGSVPLADASVTALAAELDDEELLDLLEQLRVERVFHLQGTESDWATATTSGVEEIDRMIALIAASFGRVTVGTAPGGSDLESEGTDLGSVVDRLHPEIAGPLVAGLDTDSGSLAVLAASVLRRWLDRWNGMHDDSAWPHDSPADHLFAALAADPDAARAFLHDALAHPPGLHIVTATAIDPAAATAVVLAATDPATCPVAEAGLLVRPYIAHVLDEIGHPHVPYDGRYVDLLGAVVAPWLFQMTTRAPDWGWSQPEAAMELARVMRDSDALVDLIAARDRILFDIPIDLDDPTAMSRALHEISGLMGWLDSILHDETIADELSQRALWDLGWSLVGQLASTAVRFTGVGGVAGRGLNLAVGSSVDSTRAQFERHGWWGAPRPVDVVLSDAKKTLDWRRTVFASATAIAMVDALRSRGVTLTDPPGLPHPPSADDPATCISLEWFDEMQLWLDGVEEPARTSIDAAVSTMLNSYQTSDACHDLIR
jgi:hypothetical protein